MKNNKKGFTLVELLAVVVILMIITAIAVPAFSHIQKSIKDKQYENKLDLIRVAALKYADDTNYTAFYVDDLIMNGYLEADKVIKTKEGKTYLEIDDRDNKTVMNCYIVVIEDNGRSLNAKIYDKLEPGNENYEENGCTANLPNSVSDYFDIAIKEDDNTEKDLSTGQWHGNGTFASDLTYNKYNGWWTKNNIRITINEKSGKPIQSVEWYEGSSLEKIDTSSNPDYGVADGVTETETDPTTGQTIQKTTYRTLEIGKTINGVLQQNYTARVKIDEKEYVVTTRIYIDRVNPHFYLDSNKISTTWSKKVDYAIEAYDNESGLFSYLVKQVEDTRETCEGVCPTSKTSDDWKGEGRKSITENGRYCACLIDNVGNIEKSDVLKFENIDNAKMACNIETIGEKKIAESKWYTGNVTVKVTPKMDGQYTVGASGVKLGVNIKPLEWPTTSPSYKIMTKEQYYNNSQEAYATTLQDTDVDGIIYYGHIGNEAGEDKLCAKRVYLEKQIGKPTFTDSVPDFTKITLNFKHDNPISGFNYAYCSSATESNVRATCNNGTCSCVMTVKATAAETEYTFSITNVSTAGNSNTLENVKAKNKSACIFKTQYGTCSGCDGFPNGSKTTNGRCGKTTDYANVSCTTCHYRSTIDSSVICPDAKGTERISYKGVANWVIGDYQGCTKPCGGGTKSKSAACKGADGVSCDNCTGTPNVGTVSCGGTTTTNAPAAYSQYRFKERTGSQEWSDVKYSEWTNGTKTCPAACSDKQTRIQTRTVTPTISTEKGTDGKIANCDPINGTETTVTCDKNPCSTTLVNKITIVYQGYFCDDPNTENLHESAGTTYTATDKVNLKGMSEYKVTAKCTAAYQNNSGVLSVTIASSLGAGDVPTGKTYEFFSKDAFKHIDDNNACVTTVGGSWNPIDTGWKSFGSAASDYLKKDMYIVVGLYGQDNGCRSGGVSDHNACTGGKNTCTDVKVEVR